MDFRSRIEYFDERGRSRGSVRITGTAGAIVGLGEFIADGIAAAIVRPSHMANAFKTVLQGKSSYYPSAGTTANRGPYATGNSVRQFRVGQARNAQGRFERITLFNDARNKSGKAYPGYVVQGIGWGGRRVSPARYRANFDAIRRTWDDRRGAIFDLADQLRGRRGS